MSDQRSFGSVLENDLNFGVSLLHNNSIIKIRGQKINKCISYCSHSFNLIQFLFSFNIWSVLIEDHMNENMLKTYFNIIYIYAVFGCIEPIIGGLLRFFSNREIYRGFVVKKCSILTYGTIILTLGSGLFGTISFLKEEDNFSYGLKSSELHKWMFISLLNQIIIYWLLFILLIIQITISYYFYL